MKLIRYLPIFLIPLLACSTVDLIRLAQAATPSPPPTGTATVIPSETATPTITGTLPTPTFTYTPTLIGQKPIPTQTGTSAPETTDQPEMTPTEQVQQITFPEGTGFVSAAISAPQIYYGACEPVDVAIRVQAVETERVSLVVFFLRLRDKATGEDSGWDIGTTMVFEGAGSFTLLLNANDLHAKQEYANYSDAWMEFQLVALDENLNEVGRTEKVVDALSISACPEGE